MIRQAGVEQGFNTRVEQSFSPASKERFSVAASAAEGEVLPKTQRLKPASWSWRWM